MKKRYLPLALMLFSLPLLPGCSTGFDENALTVMGKQSDLQRPYMTAIFDHYKQKTGENLNILSVVDEEYESKALDMLSRGELPDVFLHFYNSDLSRYNTAENFCYLNDQPWVDDLTDSAKAYCSDEHGNLLGLPFWESSVSGCYYNKKLINSFGLEAATTQEDFEGLCARLKRAGVTPILWPGDGCSWMVQFGLDPIFADDSALLKQINNNEISYAEIPAVTDMVTWLADAANKGWFGDNYLNTGWDDISHALASGEAAMTFIWDTWFYTDFKPEKYTVDDFALMPIFMGTARYGTYEDGNLNMMMVNKNSDKKERALDFLAYCATPENYNDAFRDIPTVSVFKGQNTNIQSKMVTDASASIAELERASTANTKIVGYNAEDAVNALNALFRKNLTVAQCVARMDELRIAKARELGVANF